MTYDHAKRLAESLLSKIRPHCAAVEIAGLLLAFQPDGRAEVYKL